MSTIAAFLLGFLSCLGAQFVILCLLLRWVVSVDIFEDKT